MMNPDQILKQLKFLANPAFRDSISYFAPQEPTETGGPWTALGVPTKKLREFEKPLFSNLKTEDDFTVALRLCDEAFERRQRELAAIGYDALMKLKKHWQPDIQSYMPLDSTDIRLGCLRYGWKFVGEHDHKKSHYSW